VVYNLLEILVEKDFCFLFHELVKSKNILFCFISINAIVERNHNHKGHN